MYLEWAKVSTPMAGSWSDVAAGLPNATDELDPPGGEGVSAAEWLFMYESRGTNIGKCGEPNLLARYWRGKMMRDWWTKQKGWWDKNAIYICQKNGYGGLAHFRLSTCSIAHRSLAWFVTTTTTIIKPGSSDWTVGHWKNKTSGECGTTNGTKDIMP